MRNADAIDRGRTCIITELPDRRVLRVRAIRDRIRERIPPRRKILKILATAAPSPPPTPRRARKCVLKQYTCMILQQSKKIGEPGFSLSENPDSPVTCGNRTWFREFLWEVGRSR